MAGLITSRLPTEHAQMSLNISLSSVRTERPHIACVIPCYKVRNHILQVLSQIGPEVSSIYVVDDLCPEHSGQLVQTEGHDQRVRVIFNAKNLGVGGAVMRGYAAAIDAGAEIIVKIDGDNQMDPTLLLSFVAPILSGDADYVKGNRFFDPEALSEMPFIRIFGNSCLSFLAKLSTGYWNLFDPTNGYTAIHATVAKLLPAKKISQRYFFETDILFRLNSIGAVAVDLPMTSSYANEVSNLRISKIIPEFLAKHARNTWKRLIYKYLIRDFSIATFELIGGICLVLFGIVYGLSRWHLSATSGLPATAGMVMLAALPTFVGIQFLLAFLNYDITSVPRRPLHPTLTSRLRSINSFANSNKI